MAELRFRCFLGAGGRDVVEKWLKDQSRSAAAEFLNIVTALADQPAEDWRRPEYSVLSRECVGLSEIRFKADNAQYRWLGTFIDGDFVLLLPAKQRDRKFVPPKACKTALKRKKESIRNPERTHVCDF